MTREQIIEAMAKVIGKEPRFAVGDARVALQYLEDHIPGLSEVIEGKAVVVPKGAFLDTSSAISIAARGLLRWAEKPHNSKWWRRLDGTPIVNDLPIVIAEEFVSAIRARDAASPYTKDQP